MGGALVGGTSGAATASSVELYNQMNHKNSLVPSSCTATGPCNEAVMTAQMNATGANAQASPINAIGPDYVTVGGSTMTAGAGLATNTADGTPYLSYSVSQSFRPASFAPGATATLAWIFGASGAQATNNFMNRDGNQFMLSVPTPVGPNAVVAITHAYGGPTALEVGVATPGPISVSVTPWSHSTPIINSK